MRPAGSRRRPTGPLQSIRRSSWSAAAISRGITAGRELLVRYHIWYTSRLARSGELHRRWSKDPTYGGGYHGLEENVDLARTLIEARTAAGRSQAQLARRMKTSQSYIARMEGGKVRPSTDALERFAQATRTRLRILFEPAAAR